MLEVFPDALMMAGAMAWIWLVLGLALFVFVRNGLDYIGQRGLVWVATLGIWLHSFLEGGDRYKLWRRVPRWGCWCLLASFCI